MSELFDFRASKDEFLAKDHHSPLTHEQRHEFNGLEYFPENPDLRLELDIEEFKEKEVIQMQTSTGDVQNHTRFGKIHFTVRKGNLWRGTLSRTKGIVRWKSAGGFQLRL
jgi:uncharacterized protein (DUF1684 family)